MKKKWFILALLYISGCYLYAFTITTAYSQVQKVIEVEVVMPSFQTGAGLPGGASVEIMIYPRYNSPPTLQLNFSIAHLGLNETFPLELSISGEDLNYYNRKTKDNSLLVYRYINPTNSVAQYYVAIGSNSTQPYRLKILHILGNFHLNWGADILLLIGLFVTNLMSPVWTLLYPSNRAIPLPLKSYFVAWFGVGIVELIDFIWLLVLVG